MVMPGFGEIDVQASAARIHGVVGGAGPAVLLLHGIPETHLMWRDVVVRLAEHFTVVATDLRGYGDSDAPAGGDYSMRSLARDQIEVMTSLGFDRFAVAGHDRGGRCAYRMAADRPDAVERLAVLDIVPTGDTFERADADFALEFWVWSFLAAPAPVPELLVAGAPDTFVDHMLDAWSGDGFQFPHEVRDRYVAQFRDVERVHAICAQYRAAAERDAALDVADRGRRPILCPVLALWGEEGGVADWDPLGVWRRWAVDVSGRALPGGHFCPEEVPEVVVDELLRFLRR